MMTIAVITILAIIVVLLIYAAVRGHPPDPHMSEQWRQERIKHETKQNQWWW